MTALKYIFVMALMSLLLACSNEDEVRTEVQVQKTQIQERQEQGGVIPPAQLDALKKAQGIEQTLKQADEQRRQQIEAQ